VAVSQISEQTRRLGSYVPAEDEELAAFGTTTTADRVAQFGALDMEARGR
jgi:hypothetical protein